MERPQHYRFHQGQKALPFTADEYEARLAKLRTSMAEKGIDPCVLTSMHNVAYYSGFLYCAFGRPYGLVVTAADTSFQLVRENQTLLEIIAQGSGVCLTAYVCLRGSGGHQSFTAAQLADYASKKAIDQAGLVDFSDYTVAQLLDDDVIKTSSAILVVDAPMISAVQLLQKNARIKSLIISEADGSPMGVIVRAHRRY